PPCRETEDRLIDGVNLAVDSVIEGLAEARRPGNREVQEVAQLAKRESDSPSFANILQSGENFLGRAISLINSRCCEIGRELAPPKCPLPNACFNALISWRHSG